MIPSFATEPSPRIVFGKTMQRVGKRVERFERR